MGLRRSSPSLCHCRSALSFGLSACMHLSPRVTRSCPSLRGVCWRTLFVRLSPPRRSEAILRRAASGTAHAECRAGTAHRCPSSSFDLFHSRTAALEAVGHCVTGRLQLLLAGSVCFTGDGQRRNRRTSSLRVLDHTRTNRPVPEGWAEKGASDMSKRIPSWFLMLLMVTGITVLGLFWSVAAYATFPGTDGAISFRGGNDMDTMEPDGTDVTQLTHSPGNDRYPSWSADGAQIVFRRVNPGGQFGIFTMNADGSNLARVTPGNTGVNTQPTWTPDGRIVFSSNRDNPTCGSSFDNCNFQLFIMDADGSNVQRLTTGTGVSLLSYALPSVSPDGMTVVFTMTDLATAGGPFLIGTIPISGGQPTVLGTKQAGDPAWPDWSPDGKKIVFSNNGCRICSSAGQPSNVFVLDLLLGTVTQLTSITAPDNYIQPHWDPDQNSIVFTNAPLPGLGPGSIYTMNSNGTGITCVIGSVAAPGQ